MIMNYILFTVLCTVLEENTFERNLAIAQNLNSDIEQLETDLESHEYKQFELQNVFLNLTYLKSYH